MPVARICSRTCLRSTLLTASLFFLPAFATEECHEPTGVLLKTETLATDSSISVIKRYLYDHDTNLVRIETEHLSLNYSFAEEFLRDHRGNVVTKLTYANSGKVQSRTEFALDSLGRVASESRYIKDELFSFEMMEYDSEGRPLAVTRYDDRMSLKSRKEFGYDEYGRLVFDTTIHPEPANDLHSRYEYDNNGNLISTVIRAINDSVVAQTETEYDVCGNPSFISSRSSLRKGGGPIEGILNEDSLFYRPEGNVVWHVKKNCRLDERNRCTQSFSRDSYGIPDTFITLEGAKTTVTPLSIQVIDDSLEIDLPKPFARTVAISVPGIPGKRIVSLTNLTPAGDTLGQLLRFFDTDNRPARNELRDSTGLLHEYAEDTYDSVGNHITHTRFSVGGTERFRTEFEYDFPGRVNGISRFKEGSLSSAIRLSYNSDGHVTERRVYNSSMYFTRRHLFEYDTDGRRVSHTLEDATEGTMLRRIDFNYDEQGRRLRESIYDGKDSLEGTISYTHDSLDNVREIEAECQVRVLDGGPVIRTEYMKIAFDGDPEAPTFRADFEFSRESGRTERDYYTILYYDDPDEHLRVNSFAAVSKYSRLHARAARGALGVNLPEGTVSRLLISIMDMRGRLVAQYDVPEVHGGTVTTIDDIGRLGAGNYIAEIKYNSQRHSTFFQVRD